MMKFRFGLIAKFATAVCLVIILISIFQSIFMVQLEKLRAEWTLKEHALTLARNLAYASEYGVLAKNLPILNRLTEGLAKDKEIVLIQILDKKGNILTRVTKEIASDIPVFYVEYPIKSTKVERPPEEIGLAPLVPPERIKEELIGNVKIGMSHAEIFKETRRILAITSMINLSLIAIGIFAIFLLSKYLLVTPLRQLVSGTQKIAQGDLSLKVDIRSQDELGALATSFNIMTEKLKLSKDEIDAYTKNLEQLVKERTKELEETIEKLKQTTHELEHAKTGLEAEVAKRTAELEKEKASLEEKVKERTKELQEKLEELEMFHDAAVGRELKMMELEKEIETLKHQMSKTPNKL